MFKLQATARGTANAPRGAMQFEVTHELLARAFGESLWVMPKQRFITPDTACRKCSQMYPIVLELLPRDLEQMARHTMKAEGTTQLAICECNGRVIE